MKDIVNGDIVSVENIDGKCEVNYVVGERGYTYSSRIDFQADIDYAGMYLQVRFESTPMHYSHSEWISAGVE